MQRFEALFEPFTPYHELIPSHTGVARCLAHPPRGSTTTTSHQHPFIWASCTTAPAQTSSLVSDHTRVSHTRAPTSPRSIGFCAIWDCISSSSSSSRAPRDACGLYQGGGGLHARSPVCGASEYSLFVKIACRVNAVQTVRTSWSNCFGRNSSVVIMVLSEDV